MMYLQATLLLLCYFVLTTDTARILCVHPSPSKSHVIVSKALLTELAAKGHEVNIQTIYTLVVFHFEFISNKICYCFH